MVKAVYVYQRSDNRFIGGGFAGDPPALDLVNFGVHEFADADRPDLRLHRYDPQTGKRLATAQELVAADDADALVSAAATSRQKYIAATIAFVIRHRDVAAWNALTANQKKAAVLAGCDAWRDLRALVEKLL